MAQNQYFDIKPKSGEGAVLFNDLINVVPVPAPWTGMGTRYNDIVDNSDNNYFFYRKRKGIKYIDTYHYENSRLIKDTDEWLEGEFTDMAILNGRRYFLRKDKSGTKLRVYTQMGTSPKGQLCDDPINQGKIIALRVSEELTHPEHSGVNQMRDNITFKTTRDTYGRFLKTQGVVDPYHMLKRTFPFYIIRWMKDSEDESIKTAVNYYVIDFGDFEPILESEGFNYIYFREKGLTVEIKNKVCDDVVSSFGLEMSDDHNYYFVESDALLANFPFTKGSCDDFYGMYDDKIEYGVELSFAKSYGDNLAFCTSSGIISFSGPAPDNETLNIVGDVYSTSTITSATMWNNRICFLNKAGGLFVSGEGYNQYNFVTGPAGTTDGDQVHGVYNVGSRFTTIIPEYYTLILAGPHDMAYRMGRRTSQYSEPQGLYEISDKVGIFSNTAYCAKDGKVFIGRSYKDVYYMEMSPNSYGMQTWNFTYYSATRRTRLKDLVQGGQEMNIDMTDNEMFVSIYENSNRVGSMVLCEDRHYNTRYTWLFEGIKISRVLDGGQIFLGDRIYEYGYEYDIETDQQHNITEVIDMIFGDETPSANKMFMFYKLAIGDNSVISNDTWLNTYVTSGSRYRDRSVHITNTRYVSMLNSKNSDTKIRQGDFGYSVTGHGDRYKSTFQRELKTYAGLKEAQKYNPRQSAETASGLGLYSVIKESIGQEGELLQITLISTGNDNLEFGSVFIGRYPKDYDFVDIQDANVDSTELTIDAETEGKINVESEI